MSCSVGINLEEKTLMNAPCFYRNSDIPCSNRIWPTLAELVAEEARHNKILTGKLKAVIQIRGSGISSGVIQCPICDEKLNFSVCTRNGHIHAACETENCISIRQ